MADDCSLDRCDLERKMIRQGVKLYGTRWCAECRSQKMMLAGLSPRRWHDLYVDCGVLCNALEASCVKKVPTWRISGKWYEGKQTQESLTSLMELSPSSQRWRAGEHVRRHKRRAQWAVNEYANFLCRSVSAANADSASHRAASA